MDLAAGYLTVRSKMPAKDMQNLHGVMHKLIAPAQVSGAPADAAITVVTGFLVQVGGGAGSAGAGPVGADRCKVQAGAMASA